MTGKDEEIRSTASVHEVSGAMDATQVQSMIRKTCGAKSTVIDTSRELSISRKRNVFNVVLTLL